jgi:hypothetical protein
MKKIEKGIARNRLNYRFKKKDRLVGTSQKDFELQKYLVQDDEIESYENR